MAANRQHLPIGPVHHCCVAIYCTGLDWTDPHTLCQAWVKLCKACLWAYKRTELPIYADEARPGGEANHLSLARTQSHLTGAAQMHLMAAITSCQPALPLRTWLLDRPTVPHIYICFFRAMTAAVLSLVLALHSRHALYTKARLSFDSIALQ